MNDKEFFQEFQKYAKEITKEEDIIDSFPKVILKIFFDLPDDEVDNAVEGLSHNDDSIDAYWVDEEEGVIHIAQMKSVKSHKYLCDSADKKWFAYLSNVPDKLANHSYTSQHTNSRIRDIGDDFVKWKIRDYAVKLHLFHLGNTADKNTIQHYRDIEYYNYRDIKDKWLEYFSRDSEDLPGECDINFEDTGTITMSLSGPHKRFSQVLIVNGYSLVKLREKYKLTLFERNVRCYLGSGRKGINHEIVNTVENTPEYFYYYNNGITISCSRYRVKEESNKVSLENPQIINGAQTVNAIYDAYCKRKKKEERTERNDQVIESKLKEHFSKVKVLVRIVQSTKDEMSNFSQNLTRYNNSQNSIEVVDYRSNDKVQEKLQKEFAKLGYFYEVKRGEYNALKKEEHPRLKKTKKDFHYFDESANFSIKILAASYQAFKGKPSNRDVAWKRILSPDNNEGYESLFGKSIDITEKKIKEMLFAHFLFQEIEKQCKIYSSAYNKMLSLSHKLTLDDLKTFIKKVQELSFLGNNVIEKVKQLHSITSTENENYKDAIERFVKYRLASTGKYFIVATVAQILSELNYLERIIELPVERYASIIQEIICSWMARILVSIILKVYKKDSNINQQSEKVFYSDIKSFDSIRREIENFSDYGDLARDYSLKGI